MRRGGSMRLNPELLPIPVRTFLKLAKGGTVIVYALQIAAVRAETARTDIPLDSHAMVIDQKALLETVRRNPQAATACFQLGLFAEKRRDWYEAAYWMEEFLKIDFKSELAAKIRQELTYLRWVALFEQTSRGSDHRRSLDLLAAARGAFDQKEWLSAGTKAYEALYADPANYEAHLVAAAAAEKIDRYDLAIVILNNAQLHAPQKLHPEIDQAISRCERLKTFGEEKIAADQAFASGKRAEASDAYFRAWEAAPERVDAAVSGVQAAVIAEDYPKAEIILTKLEATGIPPECLPLGFRDIPDLLSRLESLQRSHPGKSATASSGKRRNGKSSVKTKKTMAADFLSRIKK